MNRNKKEQLLESCLKEIVEDILLKEQEGFKQDVLYRAFVEPFTDIVATAAHGVEKIAAHAGMETKLLAKQLAFTLLPFLNPDAGSLKNMAAADRKGIAQKLSAIDNDFKDVLDRNWKTFNNPDIWGTLFLLNPQLAITQKILTKAPEVALELLGVLTGGSEEVSSLLSSYRNYKTGGRDSSVSSGGGGGGGGGGSMDYMDYGDGGDYGGMYEQAPAPRAPRAAAPAPVAAPAAPRPAPRPAPTAAPAPAPRAAPGPAAAPAAPANQAPSNEPPPDPRAWLKAEIKKLMKQPEINKKIATSTITKAMQREAVGYILKAAKKDLAFSWADVKTKLGGNYDKALSSLLKGEQGEDLSKEIETNQELQKKVVQDLKAMLKPAYIKQLQSLLQTAPNAKQAVNQAIQKINAL